MPVHIDIAPPSDRVDIRECWSRIGAYGDRSCEALAEHVHCRNCPVYVSGARALFDRPLSDAQVAEWTAHVARSQPRLDTGTRSILIFRVDEEWLAVPTPVVAEVGAGRPVHSLPNRRDRLVVGLANVRGQLLTCVSLERLLGLPAPDEAAAVRKGRERERRLLVLRQAQTRVVCHVQEVHGVHHCAASGLLAIPDTMATPIGACSEALYVWRDRSVGILDVDVLFDTLRKNLS